MQSYLLELTIYSLTADGRCIIQPHLVRGELTARASLREVAAAAGYVIDQCVTTRQSQGGNVRDIGEHLYPDQGSKIDDAVSPD